MASGLWPGGKGHQPGPSQFLLCDVTLSIAMRRGKRGHKCKHWLLGARHPWYITACNARCPLQTLYSAIATSLSSVTLKDVSLSEKVKATFAKGEAVWCQGIIKSPFYFHLLLPLIFHCPAFLPIKLVTSVMRVAIHQKTQSILKTTMA